MKMLVELRRRGGLFAVSVKPIYPTMRFATPLKMPARRESLLTGQDKQGEKCSG
jgi:hypothetical protein